MFVVLYFGKVLLLSNLINLKVYYFSDNTLTYYNRRVLPPVVPIVTQYA